MCKLDAPDDHVFLAIGDPENSNEECYILDQWAKYLNFNGIDSSKKQYGFIGQLKDYIKFLKHNEDGDFIKKGNFHKIKKFPSNAFETSKFYQGRIKEQVKIEFENAEFDFAVKDINGKIYQFLT
jgi:hypothetical protein